MPFSGRTQLELRSNRTGEPPPQPLSAVAFRQLCAWASWPGSGPGAPSVRTWMCAGAGPSPFLSQGEAGQRAVWLLACRPWSRAMRNAGSQEGTSNE